MTHATTPHTGMTLLELMVGLGIFSLLALAGGGIFISALRSNDIVWAELAAQHDGRRALQRIVDDVRRAEASNIGAYPIATAETSTLIFYANIDRDAYRERVRYSLVSTTLERGVIKPSGNPLQYIPADETVTTIAGDVVNLAENIPLFTYFDERYTGTEPPLTSPVSTTAVHLIRMQLELEADPTKTPIPFHVETMAHIRNLKTN